MTTLPLTSVNYSLAERRSNIGSQGVCGYRHRITFAETYDLPLGKGRAYMANTHWLLDAIVGGWQFSSTIYWSSGNLLNFGGMLWDGTDPKVSNPTPQQWFNTSGFQRIAGFHATDQSLGFLRSDRARDFQHERRPWRRTFTLRSE